MIIVPHVQISHDDSYRINRAISSGGGLLAGSHFNNKKRLKAVLCPDARAIQLLHAFIVPLSGI